MKRGAEFMTSADFRDMSMGFYETDERVPLWGRKVRFAIYVERKLLGEESDRLFDELAEGPRRRYENDEITLDEYEQIMDGFDIPEGLPERTVTAALKIMELAEKSRPEVARSMIKGGMAELAGDWESQGADEEVEVTDEEFSASFYPVDITVEFQKSLDKPDYVYLELCCDPDYFLGHRIHVKLMADGRAVCEGI